MEFRLSKPGFRIASRPALANKQRIVVETWPMAPGGILPVTPRLMVVSKGEGAQNDSILVRAAWKAYFA